MSAQRAGAVETWYQFCRYNGETVYGYGSEEAADRYAERLNRTRDINLYVATPVTDPGLVARLDETEGLGVDIVEEMAWEQ